jgi:hypothetical protein
MKKIILGIGVLLLIGACATQKKLTERKARPVEIEQNDSLGYELETFDLKFETWYTLQNNPSQYRSQSFYEGWNKLYVAAWEAKAMDPVRNPFFEPIIGYDPTVDYGFELNHKLFYYFQYVERVLKIPILSNGPHVFLF